MLRSSLALLLIAGALPAAAEPLHYNIVEFSESAVTDVRHDTMTVRFQVSAEGKNRNAVADEFTRKFNSFNRKAKNSAFKTELLNRTALPRYQFNNGKRTQTGWEEIAEFKVESQDFAALNRLISDTRSEASVRHTEFSVSKKKREAAIDEVSQAAIVRFKQRAQTLAQTLGFNQYKIVKLNLGHIGSNSIIHHAAPAEMKMARSAAAVSNMDGEHIPDPVSPGSEEVAITVNGSVQM